MHTRLSIAIVATLALGVGQPAWASPITFDFTGTLKAPINGTEQLSGSFTINGDPTPTGWPYPLTSVNENGSDVSITVNMGGQVFHFDNGQNPLTTASFTTGPSPTWIMQGLSGPPQASTWIGGGTSSSDGSPGAEFGMTFYSPALLNLTNLRDLSLPLGSGSVYVTTSSSIYGIGVAVGGDVTSIELVPTPAPEPSTLAIFAALGIATMAYRHRSRSRAL
jgi:hypothetical protein